MLGASVFSVFSLRGCWKKPPASDGDELTGTGGIVEAFSNKFVLGPKGFIVLANETPPNDGVWENPLGLGWNNEADEAAVGV